MGESRGHGAGARRPGRSLPARRHRDKAVDLATSNSDQVIRPAADSPYSRMAVVADQHGAVFSLISTPAEG